MEKQREAAGVVRVWKCGGGTAWLLLVPPVEKRPWEARAQTAAPASEKVFGAGSGPAAKAGLTWCCCSANRNREQLTLSLPWPSGPLQSHRAHCPPSGSIWSRTLEPHHSRKQMGLELRDNSLAMTRHHFLVSDSRVERGEERGKVGTCLMLICQKSQAFSICQHLVAWAHLAVKVSAQCSFNAGPFLAESAWVLARKGR